MNQPPSKTSVYLLIAMAILIVGLIDYITGSEIRILALYFLPLIWAGWSLEIVGALLAALFAVSTWIAVMYLTGTHFSNPIIWFINALTEGLGFVTVSLAFALLRATLIRERMLSRHDQLTGLANRRSFIELVTRGLMLSRRNGHPISMAYIDLDNFKQVNDRLGHPRGDELLRQCAALITSCVRASDTVARLGGDEFAIFLPETDAANATTMIERIRATIEIAPSFHALGVTTSIGLVCEDPCVSEIDTLLSKADLLMYEIKRGGKNAFGVLC